jgi:hypothetical protein
MRDFSQKLVPLLEDKIRVMIYAGEPAHACCCDDVFAHSCDKSSACHDLRR